MANGNKPRAVRRRNNNGGNGMNGNGKNGGQPVGVTRKMGINGGSMPAIYNSVVRRQNQTSTVRMVGTDFLENVTVGPTSTVADRIRTSFRISPSAFAGTRISGLSQYWERYRFKKLNVRWVPAVPTALACQLIGYIDTDPNDDPQQIATTVELARTAVAHGGSAQWNFHVPKVVNLLQRKDDQWYYTGIDRQNQRFSDQGKFFLIQITDPINFSGTPVTDVLNAGTLYLDWDVEFQLPQIEPETIPELITTTDSIDLPAGASQLWQLELTDSGAIPGFSGSQEMLTPTFQPLDVFSSGADGEARELIYALGNTGTQGIAASQEPQTFLGPGVYYFILRNFATTIAAAIAITLRGRRQLVRDANFFWRFVRNLTPTETVAVDKKAKSAQPITHVYSDGTMV